jgi:hypothetical protein
VGRAPLGRRAAFLMSEAPRVRTSHVSSTETDSSIIGAVYEVHIIKSDGTRAVVMEDSSFTVLATQAQTCPHSR